MSSNEPQNDEAAREKAINDWLPVTSSRNAKWWYSTFHNVTAMVGAGVLSLPYAMAQLGWYVSINICLILTLLYTHRSIYV
jgi:amino acid permease